MSASDAFVAAFDLLPEGGYGGTYQGKRYRLPKGHAAYDKPFKSGWPRDVREVESERELANIHGTVNEMYLESVKKHDEAFANAHRSGWNFPIGEPPEMPTTQLQA